MAKPSRGKLTTYRRKRDFETTPEPSGRESCAPSRNHLFVIQKHRARSLHWDLRLEIGGALASWAVPKEPTTDPGARRLAVKVEDHPLEYGDFEGTIPKGQYGAGTVEIWDRGNWRTKGDAAKQIRDGKLVFDLDGKRLKGKFALTRMKTDDSNDNWLLMCLDPKKHTGMQKIHGAKKGKLPTSLSPQLCRPGEVPVGEGWLREVKWDGYRALVFVTEGGAELRSRTGKVLRVSEVAEAISGAGLPPCIIDGELVCLDKKGVSSFRLLQQAFSEKRTDAIKFYAFDLVHFGAYDLRGAPLVERKAALREIVNKIGSDFVRFSEHSGDEVDARELFENACKSGLEGIISKRADSKYASRRASSWIKTHCTRVEDVVICGFTPMKGHRGKVGALVAGILDNDGRLLYAGKVGTGFSEGLRRSLYSGLSEIEVSKHPFVVAPPGDVRKVARWVRPELHAAVRFLEWTDSGAMRQPRFVEMKRSNSRKSRPAIEISNADRVIDKATGTTKGGVAEFYEFVSEFVLPHVAGRPLPIIRCPEGLAGECFFQKHWMRGLSESVEKVRIKEERKTSEYMVVSDVDGLIGLAQMGMIELHPWGSRADDLDRPDRLIFDLDPGEGVAWSGVVQAAMKVRDKLRSIGLESFAKVTGGKGVHVVLPIKPELNWDQCKSFCRVIAETIAKEEPKKYVATASKEKRRGKVFIDYLRNSRGATAVAPYSLRAKPGLPVALPMEWNELNKVGRANAFDIASALKKLRRRKSDPWEGFRRLRQSLPTAIAE